METRKERVVNLGDFCRFKPLTTRTGELPRRFKEGLINLAIGEIVKVVTTLEDGMCYVNKPGNCPVVSTMELVETDWLELLHGEFIECDYCAAIDHKTPSCPYIGKVPFGWKGIGPWRIEGGEMLFDCSG